MLEGMRKQRVEQLLLFRELQCMKQLLWLQTRRKQCVEQLLLAAAESEKELRESLHQEPLLEQLLQQQWQ